MAVDFREWFGEPSKRFSFATLVDCARDALVKYIAGTVARGSVGDGDLRAYLMGLPVCLKQQLLHKLQQSDVLSPDSMPSCKAGAHQADCPLKKIPKFVRMIAQPLCKAFQNREDKEDFEQFQSFYLDCIRRFWSVLYCSNFQRVEVPDLRRACFESFKKAAHYDEWYKLDFSDFSQVILDVIKNGNACFDGLPEPFGRRQAFSCVAKEIRLTCYQSEKMALGGVTVVLDLVSTFRNVRVLELGFGCDDIILREIGEVCHHICALTICGSGISNNGLLFLCGYRVIMKEEIIDVITNKDAYRL